MTFVLTSRTRRYRFRTVPTVALGCRHLLALHSLRILNDKDEVIAALECSAKPRLWTFPDCLAALSTTRQMSVDGIYSYDRGFDRIPDIRRLEP